MNRLALVVALQLLMATAATAAVDYTLCPDVTKLAAGDYSQPTTIRDVMYQFQDHLGLADDVIHRGKGGAPMTDADLRGALDHVESARNCALIAARNSAHGTAPEKAAALSPKDRDDFLADFQEGMTNFAGLLGRYHDLIQELAAKPAGSRDFSGAYDQSLRIDESSVKAHAYFNH